jgi:phosphatidate cytidylyltransferase
LLPARILTAALLLAVFLAALFWLERWQFALLVGAVVGIAAREWAVLAGLARIPAYAYTAAVVIAYGALTAALLAAPTAGWTFAIATVFWLAVAPVWLNRGLVAAHRPWLVPAGFVVIVPAGAAMLALQPRVLLAVMALAWVADTAAYFTGRAWGRRKLAPTISPGKTVEGAIGALVAAVFYAIICAHLLPELQPPASGAAWIALIMATLLLTVLSILGDLFESALKRQAGAKDSGNLLPGHGGVLDRIDSATSTLPVAALMFQFLQQP